MLIHGHVHGILHAVFMTLGESAMASKVSCGRLQPVQHLGRHWLLSQRCYQDMMGMRAWSLGPGMLGVERRAP